MRQAEGELKAANELYSTSNYSRACFASQQAAEKAIMAILEHLLSPRAGHDLSDLIADVKARIEVPTDVEEACSRLNKMYIPTRYPNAFASGAPVEKLTMREAARALEDGQLVVGFARKITGTA